MAEISTSIPFPIVVFDGNLEIDAGNISFSHSIRFGKLRSLICQKIGIPPTQISLFLAWKKSRSSHRKIPIHRKSDFEAIAREKNCFFCVVLRPPPKRERKRKLGRNLEDDDYFPKTLLRRRDEKQGLDFLDYKKQMIVCEQCLISEENPIPFHFCVHDVVTVDFRSKAGPIERPFK